MRKRPVIVASKNPDKVREVEDVLASIDAPIQVLRGHSWPDVAETGSTLLENALLKARAVVKATGHAALADDTGLEVAALDGRPGVETARFAGPRATYNENVEALLKAMADRVDRAAVFRTVVALVDPAGTEVSSEGLLVGSIAEARRGSGGFGYDPVFTVEEAGGTARTLAEMHPTEKNLVSHRARALRSLVRSLVDQPL